jgi:quinol monooxygenase YgiN
MFRHIVLVRFKAEATDADKQAVEEALSALPAQVPEIRAIQLGADVGRKANNWDLATVIDFDDAAAFQRYLQSPAHRAYAEGPGRAAVASLAVVQHPW